MKNVIQIVKSFGLIMESEERKVIEKHVRSSCLILSFFSSIAEKVRMIWTCSVHSPIRRRRVTADNVCLIWDHCPAVGQHAVIGIATTRGYNLSSFDNVIGT
jgi:hypothetical protein